MDPLFPRSGRFFLGVERSALGKSWRDRLDKEGQARALANAQLGGHNDILSRVLSGRGISLDESADYLDPSLRRLMPDPCSLMDMTAVAETIARAIERCDKIAIFGDYDVDGAASCALLSNYLGECGFSPMIYIPDRISEGYGPNVNAIRSLAAAGAKLLITVDCGTASHEPLAEARRLGVDSIVLDHHQAPEALPDALVVNPNRQDDSSKLGHLCATGVVFMTLVALSRVLRDRGFFHSRPEPDLLSALDLVSLATIADVAPLIGLNRAFVTKGLAVMRRRTRPGLSALFDVANVISPPSSYHLGFVIGPRINAGGRIGDATLGSRLLSVVDPGEARRIAEELDRLNRDRQSIENAALEEAEEQALSRVMLDDASAAVIVASDDWHPGVVGLVASRLKDRFQRPAFAIAWSGKCGTGSGRSVPGIDLGRVVRTAVAAGILVKGGGHAMAAGISVTRERIDDFRKFLEEALTPNESRSGQVLLIDAALTASGATPDLFAELERAGPFGPGNAEPVFVLPAHRLIDVSEVGNGHIRIRMQGGDGARMDGIAFRAGGRPLELALRLARGTPVHLAGTLALEHWGGSARVRFHLVDFAPSTGRQAT